MKPLPEPRELGSYLLVAELGRGAMGVVYLGVTQNGILVALKRVREQFLDDDEFRARFRREVDSSREVSSSHTAAVIDSDVDADPPWLASEFINGPTLEKALEATGPLPEVTLMRLAQGLTRALADIHRTGLIHRDLKPSNVILAEDGPRVIDFGIARAAETAGGTDITHTSWLLGSPGYMSPEQAESKPVSTASDMFSMATVLYVAATGDNPFKGAGSPQTMYNVVHSHPDLDVLSPWVHRVVEPCWAKDPQARPSAADVLDDIGEPETATLAWPAPVLDLIDERDIEIAGLLPDETIRFHDGQTRIFPDEKPAAAEGQAASTPPRAPMMPPSPAPSSMPSVIPQLTPQAIGWIVVAGLVAIIVLWGAMSEGVGNADDTAGSGDTTTSAFDDDPTEDDEYVDDETSEYIEDEPTQDDIVDVVTGDCVYGSSEVGADWDIEACQDGNFTVLERIDGETDYDACDDSDEMLDYGQHITDFGGGTDTDFVMCLSMNWPQGDIAHAPVDTCLYMSGPDGDATFEFADCDDSNVYVTGYTPTYNDPGFCGQDGAAWDKNDEFDMGYTVCYRSL